MYLEKFSIVHNTYYNQPNISNVQVELESFNFNNVKNVLKQLIDKVIKFFKDVYNYIKSVVSKFKNSKHLKNLKNKINYYKQFKDIDITNELKIKISLLSIEDINKIIELIPNFRKVSLIKLLLHPESNYSFDSIISDTNKYLEGIKQLYVNIKNTDISVFNEDVDIYGDYLTHFLGTYSKHFLEVIASNNAPPGHYTPSLDKVSKDINNIEKHIQIAEHFYNKHGKPLEKELNDLNRNITNNKEDYWKIKAMIGVVTDIIKLAYTPMYVVLNYSRILSEVFNKLPYSDALTTDVKPEGKLYHLSINSNLDKLNPDSTLTPIFPKSGESQLLPKRVCFAPDILRCCIGTQDLFKSKIYSAKRREPLHEGYSSPEYASVILYLYEGMPNKDTKYIKPNIVKIAVGEALFSNEICVTTPIQVKKIGKVVITFNALKMDDTYQGSIGIINNYDYDPSVFVKWSDYSGPLEPKD